MKIKTKIAFGFILVFVVFSCNSKGHKDTDMPPKNEATAPNEIMLTDQQIKLGNITTRLVSESQGGMVRQQYAGILVIDEGKNRTVSSRAMGRIEKLFYSTTGHFVNANQPLYTLYSEDIAIAKQDYISAYKQLSMPGQFGKNAQTLVSGARQKLLFYGLSSSQIESLKSGREGLGATTFYNNAEGYISEITAVEGSNVMEGESIMKLVNLNTLWLEIQVNINYIKSIHVGQNAGITFNDFPGKKVDAAVSFINPEVNPDSRMVLVRLEVANSDLSLKPGMQAVAALTQNNAQKGLYIPVDAVIREQKASYIWIEKNPGVFQNMMVETGVEANGMIEIKSKIDPAKKIVVTGAYAINSEYIFRKGSDPMDGMKM